MFLSFTHQALLFSTPAGIPKIPAQFLTKRRQKAQPPASLFAPKTLKCSQHYMLGGIPCGCLTRKNALRFPTLHARLETRCGVRNSLLSKMFPTLHARLETRREVQPQSALDVSGLLFSLSTSGSAKTLGDRRRKLWLVRPRLPQRESRPEVSCREAKA